MDLVSFVRRVCDEGIEGAKRDYPDESRAHKLEGSIEGFRLCLAAADGQDVVANLKARLEYERARQGVLISKVDNNAISARKYWRERCRCVEVEYVCNVVSAFLVNRGDKPLADDMPTASAVMRAFQLLKRQTDVELKQGA